MASAVAFANCACRYTCELYIISNVEFLGWKSKYLYFELIKMSNGSHVAEMTI